MERLPPEILREIAFQTPGKRLILLCQTNPIYAEICREDAIWQYKMIQEYTQAAKVKPLAFTWKEAYIGLVTDNIDIITLQGGRRDQHFNRSIIGYFWITPQTKYQDLFNEIYKHVTQLYPHLEKCMTDVQFVFKKGPSSYLTLSQTHNIQEENHITERLWHMLPFWKNHWYMLIITEA